MGRKWVTRDPFKRKRQELVEAAPQAAEFEQKCAICETYNVPWDRYDDLPADEFLLMRARLEAQQEISLRDTPRD